MLKLPTKVPQIGFYYHHKHSPEQGIRHHAYEVRGITFHTETGEVCADYRPLYEEAPVYQASKQLGLPCADHRPLEMWMEDVTKDGKTFPRFTKITDPKVIVELEKARAEMYTS